MPFFGSAGELEEQEAATNKRLAAKQDKIGKVGSLSIIKVKHEFTKIKARLFPGITLLAGSINANFSGRVSN
jgi:hypothetical protein